jgi:succinyl-CoA synthetase alpha subunit
MANTWVVLSYRQFERYENITCGFQLVDIDNLSQAMERLKPDATGIYVAAHQAPAAIEEAIEAEVPLIVAVAEHIPIHDIMRVGSIWKV